MTLHCHCHFHIIEYNYKNEGGFFFWQEKTLIHAVSGKAEYWHDWKLFPKCFPPKKFSNAFIFLLMWISWTLVNRFGFPFFVSTGITMYFNMPRHVFGHIQSKLWPLYFRIGTSLTVIALLTNEAVLQLKEKKTRIEEFQVGTLWNIFELKYIRMSGREVVLRLWFSFS